MLEKYFRDDGNDFYLTGHYMEMYIPVDYFETGVAVQLGDKIQTLGLVNVRIFDEKNKVLGTQLMNVPCPIMIYPKDIEEVSLQIIPGKYGRVNKYIACKFFKGDKIMPSNIAQASDNVETLIKALLAGKIDSSVPYDELLNIIWRCMELNGVGLNVPATTTGVMIEGVYRYADDGSKTFAKAAGKDPSISPYAYRTANIREICSRNSTFSALTFENFDEMLTSSLNMNNYSKKQVESPFEAIIKM